MHGITLPAYRQWKHNPTLTCAQLYVISAPEVTAFYHDQYWMQVQGLRLPVGVDLMVFDAAVNMGVSRSVKLLQEQARVAIDGGLGNVTLNAVLMVDSSTMINALALAHIEFYRSLATFPIFGKGWINRVNARLIAATALTVMS